jgi:predicted enzyme related to lactoylglutathione lyase
MAAEAATMFREAGALEIFEGWEEDIEDGKLTDFRRAVARQAGREDRVLVDDLARQGHRAPLLREDARGRFDVRRDAVRSEAHDLGRLRPAVHDGTRVMAGDPIWYELMTPDPAAVAPFYSATLGWDVQAQLTASASGHPYAMIGRSDGGFAGGLLTLTPQMAEHGGRPGWLPYFDVDGADAAVEKAKSLGGSVWMARPKWASARSPCSAIRRARRST